MPATSNFTQENTGLDAAQALGEYIRGRNGRIFCCAYERHFYKTSLFSLNNWSISWRTWLWSRQSYRYPAARAAHTRWQVQGKVKFFILPYIANDDTRLRYEEAAAQLKAVAPSVPLRFVEIDTASAESAKAAAKVVLGYPEPLHIL